MQVEVQRATIQKVWLDSGTAPWRCLGNECRPNGLEQNLHRPAFENILQRPEVGLHASSEAPDYQRLRQRKDTTRLRLSHHADLDPLGGWLEAAWDYALAKARYREALALYHPLGNSTYTARCLEGLAATLGAEARAAKIIRLFAVAAALREQAQTLLPPAEREAFEQVVTSAQAAGGKGAFAAEWTVGAALTQDKAIAYALSEACT